MEKKVIVFDLDETLRKLEFNAEYTRITKVKLRPNIDKLLAKIKEVKEGGTDIIIWTTASTESANKYFIEYLPEEYRSIFDEVITKDDKMQIESGSIEEKVYGYSTGNKPVTTLKEYDKILFFDDNKTEGYYLRNLYRDESVAPNKQVVFASYRYDPLKPYQIYAYKKISEENENVAKKVNKLFAKLLDEPGCELMIEQIDKFQKSSFVKGLTLEIDNEIMKKYRHDLSDIEDEVDDIIDTDSDLSQRFSNYMEQFLENAGQDQLENENR